MASIVVQRAIALLFLAFGLATAANAQLGPIKANAAKPWKHKESGITVPPRASGLTRVRVEQIGTLQRDVVVQLREAADDVAATIYIYRPAAGDASLWFDRAEGVLVRFDHFASADARAPIFFAPPGQTDLTALRVAHALSSGRFKSTATAVVPVGPWLVKLRISSTSLDAAALDARLLALVAELGWPRASEAAAPAYSVQACEQPLAFAEPAKELASDSAAVMLGALVSMAGTMSSDQRFCRDGERSEMIALYRADGSTDAYLLAMADSGRVVSVARKIALEEGPARYGIAMLDLASTQQFDDFDRLPSPAQALALIENGRPLSSTSVTKGGGSQIMIGVD